MSFADPYLGALPCGNYRYLPTLLSHIHEWAGLYCASQPSARSLLDEYMQQTLPLLKCIAVSTTFNALTEFGMTCYGAVALSWCKDAAIADVWSGWLTSGFPHKPLPEFERPARFINPALLPQADSLSGIATWVKAQGYKDAATYDLALCAVIAALKTPLVFDIEDEKMRKVSPQIAAFLKSRMLQKSSRSAEEEALIAVWSASVKGTEYNVWEGR